MNANFQVIGLTRLGIEPQVYRSRSRRSIPLGHINFEAIKQYMMEIRVWCFKFKPDIVVYENKSFMNLAFLISGVWIRLSWIRQIIEDNFQMHRLENHTVRLISNEASLEDVYHVVVAKLSQPEVKTEYKYPVPARVQFKCAEFKCAEFKCPI